VKIAVVGAGAMGSVYAGLLAAAGHEVWAVDVWREHVEAIESHGLRVEGASGDRTVRLRAATDAAAAGPCELVVVATKASQVEQAARDALPLLGPETVVLTIQNGLGSAERVAGVVGRERVAVGVAGGFGASLLGPGHVRHEGWELVRIGELAGPVSERLERVADAWRVAGFDVAAVADIERVVWSKLVCNTAFSGVCLLLESTIAGVLGQPEAWRVAAACARETYAAGRARGIEFEFDDPEAFARSFGETIPGARPSTLLDYLAGRPSEIDVLNGAVPGPVNRAVAALVRAKEAIRAPQAGSGSVSPSTSRATSAA
jgi:2-dehydropantoate 2-reductase